MKAQEEKSFKCKQCKLQDSNVHTYRWVESSIAQKDIVIIDTENKNKKWSINTVWHYEDSSKYLFHIITKKSGV